MKVLNGTPALPPPPLNFNAVGVIEWASFFPAIPPFIRPLHKATGRRLKGIKYEVAAQKMILAKFPQSYFVSPWLKFSCFKGVRWCQPDGILINLEEGLITIVEMKYQHTTEAWWQMRKLYEPLLRAMFPAELWRINTLEVVKWFDPLVDYPEQLYMLKELEDHLSIPSDQTGLHIWKPGKP